MKKILLYFNNTAVGFWHLILALVWQYRYHPDDGYVKNVLVVFDCFCNTLVAGDYNETISSRSGKAEGYEQSVGRWGVGCRLCSFLAVFQKDHCQRAVERNAGRHAVIPDEQSAEV